MNKPPKDIPEDVQEMLFEDALWNYLRYDVKRPEGTPIEYKEKYFKEVVRRTLKEFPPRKGE